MYYILAHTIVAKKDLSPGQVVALPSRVAAELVYYGQARLATPEEIAASKQPQQPKAKR